MRVQLQRYLGWFLTTFVAMLCLVVTPALGCSRQDTSNTTPSTAQAARPDQGARLPSATTSGPRTDRKTPTLTSVRQVTPDPVPPRATSDPPQHPRPATATRPDHRNIPTAPQRTRRHGSGFHRPPEPPKGKFGLIIMGVGTSIRDRELQGNSDVFTTEDERVFGWVAMRNTGEPTFVKMVWSRGDQPMFRIPLRVGTSQRWRTWSVQRVNLKRHIGVWRLDIFSPDGEKLGSKTFEVRAGG